jgi:polyether ionophore transport system permease protein
MAASATSAAGAPTRRGRSLLAPRRDPARALARRAFRDARVRTIAYAYLFAGIAYAQVAAYRDAYPSLASRVAFARSFFDNKAVRLFYGEPHDLLTVDGYAAWRVGGTLAIFASIFGLLAAVRALRTEEDTGRMELVLAGVVGRRTAYLSSMAAIAAGIAILWLAELAGFLLGGLPLAGSAYLALATVSVVPVYVGIGALACQIAPTRRVALELGGSVVGLLFLLRLIADTATGLGWLRWASPLGWAEELRPFTGARPLVLLLPVAASAITIALAARIAAGRDVGTGVISGRDSSEPRLSLLSSPSAQALRRERGSLLVWLGGIGVFAYILGVLAKSSSSAGISKNLEREVEKLGAGSIATPSGYLGVTFIFFVLAVSLFGCAQIGAARREEAGQQLETLLAQPVGRRRWLAGRLALASAGAVAISLAAGLLTWVGAESGGADISLAKMIEAGANCLPVALLFLGVAVLAYALVPRASGAIAYALVAVAFLWDLIGSLLGAPKWLVELTPFQHVGLVPAEPFRGQAAAIMIGIGMLAALAAVALFRRRDLVEQ